MQKPWFPKINKDPINALSFTHPSKTPTNFPHTQILAPPSGVHTFPIAKNNDIHITTTPNVTHNTAGNFTLDRYQGTVRWWRSAEDDDNDEEDEEEFEGEEDGERSLR